MTDTRCAVEDCDRPIEDGFCCSHCRWRVEQALGNVPAFAEELDTVLARQTQYAEQGERVKASNVSPLYFDPRASEMAYVLRNTLQTWVRVVWEERDYATNNHRPYPEQDTLGDMSGWLLREVEWLRHHQSGGEAFGEILYAVAETARVIDSPQNRTTFPVGPCPEDDCPGEIRVFIPATEDLPKRMVCDNCGITWHRDHFLLAGKRIVTAEADRIRPYVNTATAAVALGVTDRTIRRWIASGRLTNYGTPGRVLLDLDEVEALSAVGEPA